MTKFNPDKHQRISPGEGYPPIPKNQILVPLFKKHGLWNDFKMRQAEIEATGKFKKIAHSMALVEFWRMFVDNGAYQDEDAEPEYEYEPAEKTEEQIEQEYDAPDNMKKRWQDLQRKVDKLAPEHADWGEVLDWVATMILVEPEHIDPATVPDRRSVGLLYQASSSDQGNQWFWTKKNEYEAKTRKLDEGESAESAARRRDKRDTEELIAEVESAYDD